MLLSVLLSGGDFKDMIAQILLTLPVVLLVLSVHEAAHGYAAYKCGDRTAYNLGRLTINPLKHLDPVGFLCMLVFGFGWAKPVPINTRNFNKPKRDMALTAAAGPLANLLMGAVSACLFGLVSAWWTHLIFTDAPAFAQTVVYWVLILLQMSALYNFVFMAFNLIPIPPFDGSRIALAFLPSKIYFGIMKYERQIMLGLLVALFAIDYFTGFSPFSWVAYQLTDLIAMPAAELMWLIL